MSASRPSTKGVLSTTDAEGRYTLRGLESGSYRVGRDVAGEWRRAAFGSMASRPVTLQGDQELTGIDIRLPSQCEISGKVVDENNEPLAGVTVFLVAREYSSGALRLVFASASTTDDQGKYTLGRVGAGRAYLLLAQKRQRQLPAISDAPDDPKLRKRVPSPHLLPRCQNTRGSASDRSARGRAQGERRHSHVEGTVLLYRRHSGRAERAGGSQFSNCDSAADQRRLREWRVLHRIPGREAGAGRQDSHL